MRMKRMADQKNIVLLVNSIFYCVYTCTVFLSSCLRGCCNVLLLCAVNKAPESFNRD